MDKYLIIKLSKKNKKSIDIKSKIIIITYNTSKVNGGYRFDKLGVIRYNKNMCYCYLNLYKLGYWLNRGVLLKSKISWIAGIIGKYEIKLN